MEKNQIFKKLNFKKIYAHEPKKVPKDEDKKQYEKCIQAQIQLYELLDKQKYHPNQIPLNPF